MKNANRILWGIVLVAVGVLLGLNAFGFEIDIFFDGWWTLFLIVPCTIGLFTQKDKTGNLIGLVLGVLLLLSCRELFSFELIWKAAVPAIIVLLGLKMIFGGMFRKKGDSIKAEMKREGKAPAVKCAVFSGQDVNYDGEMFHGADLTAVFGSVKYDLRCALFDRDCVIDVCAVFGGIDILLPDDVNVKVSSTAIFGGIEDKRRGNKKENTITIYVQGLALFGGVDIQ